MIVPKEIWLGFHLDDSDMLCVYIEDGKLAYSAFPGCCNNSRFAHDVVFTAVCQRQDS